MKTKAQPTGTTAALNDGSGSKSRTARALVWNNVVIMHALVKYMEPQALVKLCLVNKQGWMSAIERLWLWPRPADKLEVFKKFSATITRRLLFEIGNYSRYGELVKVLDLSMTYQHWERILEMQRQNYLDTIIQPIASSCVNTKTLNLEMCKMLPDSSFVKLFADNSQLCNSLTELNLMYVEATDTEIGAFIHMFPKLERLLLVGTEACIVTCTTIAKCLPDLHFLDLSHSYEVDDECVRVIAKSCKYLHYLNIYNCQSIQTKDVSGMLEKLGASIRVIR